MPSHVVRKIAAPMIGLSVVLLALGVFAAWNVNKQQQASSDLFVREMHAMLAIEDLHIEMRDVRYYVNRFLRTDDPQSLIEATTLRNKTDPLLENARSLARRGQEQELIEIAATGYQRFFAELDRLSKPIISGHVPNGSAAPLRRPSSPELVKEFTDLSDVLLTNEVLTPLRQCISFNQEVVERANEANQQTAQHLKIGFLLLGICGAAAGLLTGTGIARAVGRSIVQLDISVRDVVGKLHDVRAPVTISHDGGFQGIESDLKRLEDDIGDVVRRLQQRETELLRTEQLARVGQLAAGLAHELRNPLMPMKMLVQAALDRGDDTGLKGRSLHIINDEISRLEKSIQSFLDFARPPVPEKTSVDITDLIRQVINLVNGRARQQEVKIQQNLPGMSVIVIVDQSQIRQLILNLLLNALDALPNGGTIQVAIDIDVTSPVAPKTETQPISKGEINEHDALRLPLREKEEAPDSNGNEDWFAIRIADSGPGIPTELMESIFEPFVTSKETGTGLGLSICQRIATAHSGFLTVQNREAGGAEFTLLLPFRPL
ncbi:MAG: ATP-binding protein [Planctomycetaceae bacterium]